MIQNRFVSKHKLIPQIAKKKNPKKYLYMYIILIHIAGFP